MGIKKMLKEIRNPIRGRLGALAASFYVMPAAE